MSNALRARCDDARTRHAFLRGPPSVAAQSTRARYPSSVARIAAGCMSHSRHRCQHCAVRVRWRGRRRADAQTQMERVVRVRVGACRHAPRRRVCAWWRARTHIHTRNYARATYIHICIHIHAYIHIHIHIHIYIHIYVYIHINIYINTCIYTYTYI